MEIKGKIKQKLDPITGESSNGAWKKQEFIIETDGDYPKSICIIVWGDKIDLEKFAVNDTVTVSINIESREYNGRWYTDVKAWKIDGVPGAAQPEPTAGKALEPVKPQPPNDLPF